MKVFSEIINSQLNTELVLNYKLYKYLSLKMTNGLK
jgi:hypothetical protein